MYIEVEHDKDGNLVGQIRCDDTLPINPQGKFFEREGGLPAGLKQARIQLDTLTAMAIEQGCGQKAVINSKGEPEIVFIDRCDFIRQNFKVDMTHEIPIPPGVKFPRELGMRSLVKKPPL